MNQVAQFRGLNGGFTNVPAPALQAFRTSLRGSSLQPSDAGYEEARSIWNAMIDRRPALIARCAGTTDVVHAVRFAKQHGLLFSVRGGGHNIAGLSLCDGGLVIDLGAMKGVWVDVERKTARAQAGCTLGDVDRETQLHGLAAVLGFVSTTGIAGLTVGGGFGYLTRQHGWTCDNMLSMEVVTASGEVVVASADRNPELFWALRGGGGNFGVVTSFEYRLHSVGPDIIGGAVAWKAEDAAEVLRFYRDFTAGSQRDLACVAALRIAPPAPWLPKEMHGKPIIAIFACHTGKPEAGERAVAPIKAFGKPIADILVRRPYVQMQSLLDATQPKGRRYYWKSEYLAQLDPRALETAIAHAAKLPSPHSAILLFQLQGALNEIGAGHSPAGNRDAAYVLNIAGSWESASEDARNVAWVRDSWQAMQPFSTGGVYVNFLTEDEGPERTAAAYASADLQRLAELKRRLDPDDLFRHTKRVTQSGT
jgi:FAD/FMN-containing dehydrogenase